MPKPEPLALKAAIPTTESAIKIDGGKGGSCRITLDVYTDQTDLPRILDLRGKRLYVVLTEEGSSHTLSPVDLPAVGAMRLEDQ